MDGIWRTERKGRALHVTLQPFGPPAAWIRRAAEEEAERLARFQECDLRLRWEVR
jgi:hypothetical protein